MLRKYVKGELSTVGERIAKNDEQKGYVMCQSCHSRRRKKCRLKYMPFITTITTVLDITGIDSIRYGIKLKIWLIYMYIYLYIIDYSWILQCSKHFWWVVLDYKSISKTIIKLFLCGYAWDFFFFFGLMEIAFVK